MNRLKESSYDGRQESFTYDKVGNRLSKTTNNITEKYIYNVKNQLKELQGKENTTYFTYDKQGNTIKEESNLGNNIFEYNTLNQQVKAITKEGNTLVNRYDAEGLRVEIEENEKLTKFIFHKDNVLVETDKDFKIISRFTRGYEVVAADIAYGDSNSELESNLNRCYYTVDEQGSTIFITDKDECIKNQYHYDAFGNLLNSKEEVHNRITYTGQQFDNITHQYYLRARFYNPGIGRFIQEDVYRGDGLNLYAYCANNPVGYYDPSGYKAICDTKSSSWNDYQKENKGKYHSQQEMAHAYYKEKGIDPNNRKSLRDEYMGATPSKDSATGKKVIEAMDIQGEIEMDINNKPISFKSKEDGQWYPIEYADMSHKNDKSHPGQGHRDAVIYWNEEGKKHGPKSTEVRGYMLDPKNYYLEHRKHNRSDGAKLGITYEPPEIP